MKRIDDLMEMSQKYQREIADLSDKRLDDLRAAESRRVDEELKMRAEFDDKLAVAEKSRIDAIRAVDVNAVAVASERATQQATVLANQVTASADTLRTLVSTSAATLAEQQRNFATQINDRLGALEKAQYESKGKQQVSDPQLESIKAEVERNTAARTLQSGSSAGISNLWIMMALAVTTIVAVLGYFKSSKNGQMLKNGGARRR